MRRKYFIHLLVAQARQIEYAELRNAASSILAEATKFVRAQNVATALEEVRNLVAYTEEMRELMSAMGHLTGEDGDAFEALFGATSFPHHLLSSLTSSRSACMLT